MLLLQGMDWEDLPYQKELLRTDGKAFTNLALGNATFALMAFGTYPNRCMLKSRDMEIRLTEHMQPNFHIKFLSEGLWHKGYKAVLCFVRDWFSNISLTETRPTTVSRADRTVWHRPAQSIG